MLEPHLPYGRHLIEEDDVAAVRAVLQADVDSGLIEQDDAEAVIEALRGDLLAQGPRVAAFETAFAQQVDAADAVACSSGTAALHLALMGAGLEAGDICIVPAITFLSTATAPLFCGAEVVFADVDPHTGLMTVGTLAEALKRADGRAKAVLPVHLAGRSCDMRAIAAVAREAGLTVIEDACHALGSIADGRSVGASAFSTAATFSLHPVKAIACGEGGMVTTNDRSMAERMRRLRNHGITRDPAMMTSAMSFAADGSPNPWAYEQLELGYNYRMNEMQAALGSSQLAKLDRFTARRAALARRYDELLAPMANMVSPVRSPPEQSVAHHLYVAHLNSAALQSDKARLMAGLAKRGVGTQVHYIPVYRQPYFERRYGRMHLPGAEAYYRSAIALPLFPAMRDTDVDHVVLELAQAVLG